MHNTILGDYINRSAASYKVVFWSIASFAIGILFLFWSALKGAFSSSVWPVLIALFINELIIVYGFSQKADKWCISGACLLNLCAAVSQAMFAYLNEWYIYFFGIILIVCLAIFMRTVRYGWLAFWSGLGVILFLGCCLIVPETYGVKAWLYIAGKPVLQLTEFAKLSYVLFVGSLFAIKCSETRKFWIAFFMTAFAAGLLFIINEYGTLLVIGSSFVCLVLTAFREKKGYKWVLCAIVIPLLLCLAILGYNVAAKYMDKWTCPDCETMNHKVLACTECDNKPNMLAFNFKCPTCQYTSWGDDKISNLTKNCPLCQEETFLQSLPGKLCQKLYVRGSIAYDYEFQKASGNAFHAKQNLQAIKSGQFFGNMNALIYIPNIETDSVLAGMMNRMGLLFALVVLIAFFLIFASIKRASSSMRIMAVFTLVFQALYTFAGTMNLLPMTGIGLPLLSKGGSNLVVSYALIYIMLTAIRNREVSK